MKIYIKPAELNYLSKIDELEKQCFIIAWSETALSNLITNDNSMMIVAVNDVDELVGYIGFIVMYDTAHIVNIAVKEKFRNHGIGTSLIESAVESCLKNEIYALTLEVRVSNIKAISLYEKLGFKQEGVRKGYYDDNHEDALIMWRYMLKE